MIKFDFLSKRAEPIAQKIGVERLYEISDEMISNQSDLEISAVTSGAERSNFVLVINYRCNVDDIETESLTGSDVSNSPPLESISDGIPENIDDQIDENPAKVQVFGENIVGMHSLSNEFPNAPASDEMELEKAMLMGHVDGLESEILLPTQASIENINEMDSPANDLKSMPTFTPLPTTMNGNFDQSNSEPKAKRVRMTYADKIDVSRPLCLESMSHKLSENIHRNSMPMHSSIENMDEMEFQANILPEMSTLPSEIPLPSEQSIPGGEEMRADKQPNYHDIK